MVNYFKEIFSRTENPVIKTKLRFYRVMKKLGKGAFGKVCLAQHKLTGEFIALKIMKKAYIEEKKSKGRLLQESAILKKLNHPNVMKLYETFETSEHLIFVTELCSGGDLLSYVRRRRKLTESSAKIIFK